MEKIVALCKNRGFIFAGSDIYGGLANTWDYGPLGARMKNNVKDTWRKRFIQERRNSYEVDADILMHPKVWEASGHNRSRRQLLRPSSRLQGVQDAPQSGHAHREL